METDLIDAQDIAVEVLGWLAGQPELLARFLALSGLEADGLREAAVEPGFFAGLLAFLVNHEPTLMAFCEHAGRDPKSVADAYRLLAGGAQQAGF